MTSPERTPPAETPRSEPEIIPPDRAGPWPGLDTGEWTTWNEYGVHRVIVRRVGPFRLFVWLLGALAFVAATLFLFAGALLIAIPVIAALVAGSFLAAWLRRTFRR